MEGTSYLLNPKRALVPRLLAAPYFDAYLNGRLELPQKAHAGFKECIAKLHSLYPEVKDHWACGGYQFIGSFEIGAIWSHTPNTPDIFILQGPGDLGWTYWKLADSFKKTRDESLLENLIPISFWSIT